MVERPSAPPVDTAGGDVGALECPVRADGVELMGEMRGSGYREPPSLARRADGQVIQLTPLTVLTLKAIDGRRDLAGIAEQVSAGFGRPVSVDNVRTLIDDQLRPAGLLTGADGSQPELQKSSPLLALRFKYAVTDPERTRRLTAPFAALFHPALVIAVLTALAVVTWWVLFREGLAAAAHDAFARPGLLLLVVVVTVLSAGFHEFGHAAAARRAGASPGEMGAGIYLVWPAFYTDVTDSYRLGRWGRVLTDLGGLYFNAIVAVGITVVWWFSGYDALLLVVATQLLQMIRQLTPLVRFDGYHVLADLTGVPDLFQRIKPTLLGVLPWRWRHPETTVLKPWARAVVTLWVVLVVPLLALSLYLMVITLPRLVGTAWASAKHQADETASSWGSAEAIGVVGHALGVIIVLFPVLAVGVLLYRVIRRLAVSTWRRTEDRPVRRALAGLLALLLVVALVSAWWPREGAYRPIRAYEGGTLTQAAAAALPTSGQTGLQAGDRGSITTAWAEGDARPTEDDPQLAVVLVPRDSAGETGASPESWVFPFNKPLAPGEGDNQALATTTTDGAVTYDVAFALVWVEDDAPALNSNEAFAFASCKDCAAVAVSFQVVLVTGDNHVAAPQNISAAVNYDCVNCLTYALAVQLFVTLDGPPDAQQMEQLEALWQEIADYGENIATVPLSEIQDQLTAFEEQILEIVAPEGQTPRQDPTLPPGSTPTPDPSPTPVETSPGADVTEEPTGDEPDAGTSAEPRPTPSSSPSPTPAGETPAGSPTADPTTP